MKYRDIVSSLESLNKLAKMDLPVIEALKLIKLIKKVREEYQDYLELNNNLIKKYGEPIKTRPNHYHCLPNSKGWNEYIKESEKLLNYEIDYNIKIIKLKAEKFQLSANDLINLEKFMEWI
jgi:hypothetical protein